MRWFLVAVAVLVLPVLVLSGAWSPSSSTPAQAGTGTLYKCHAKPGKKIFRERRNIADHPALWESVTEIRKTLGPLQLPDFTQTVKIEFVTPDGTITINDTLDEHGKFSGEAPVTFAGFSTNVKYRGTVYYNFQDTNKPRKETGTWKVGADGHLPGGEPITFRESCDFDTPPEPEDHDSDGVPEFLQATSTFTSSGPFTQNPGAATYLTILQNGNPIEIPVVVPQDFQVGTQRELAGDWHVYRGHSIDATFAGDFEPGDSSFTFTLPDELGGGDVTVPIEGSIVWTVIMNDAGTQVLDQHIDVSIFGDQFTFSGGDAETEDWTFEYDSAIDPVGTLDLVTGDYELTVGAFFDDENLRVDTATEQNVPLAFTGTIAGNLSPFVAAARAVDNCPDDPNPDQLDADEDGVGDVCDKPFSDFDCDGDTDPNDALNQLRSLEQLSISQEEGCPAPDQAVDLDGFSVTWGNIDCSVARDSNDALKTLAAFLGLAVDQEADCPPLT